jgi:hypothetical protein
LLQQYSQPPPRSAVVAPLPFMVKRIGQGEWCKKVIYAMSVVLKQRRERERERARSATESLNSGGPGLHFNDTSPPQSNATSSPHWFTQQFLFFGVGPKESGPHDWTWTGPGRD